jgi:integrase
MRPFEFIRLPWSRIKTEKGVTFIDIQNRSPKKKSRIIPASSLAVKLLAEWKQVAPKSEWVFPQETNPSKYISDGKRVDSWRRELKRLNDTAGPNDPIISLDKTAYYGRHSFYTHSIMVEQHNISLMSSQGGTSESTIRRVYIEDDQHHLVPLMQQREKFLKERRGSVAVATNQKADAKKK